MQYNHRPRRLSKYRLASLPNTSAMVKEDVKKLDYTLNTTINTRSPLESDRFSTQPSQLKGKRYSLRLPSLDSKRVKLDEGNSIQILKGGKNITTEVLPIQEQSQLAEIISQIRSKSNIDSVEKLAAYLKNNISPFHKLIPKAVLLILSECRLREAAAGQIIYRKCDPSYTILFIIEGTVKLSNKAEFFQRICKAGQTLCEEILFPEARFMSGVVLLETKENPKLQSARALERSFFLELKAKTMATLNEIFIFHGMKEQFMVLCNLLWRNYTTKTSDRHNCLS